MERIERVVRHPEHRRARVAKMIEEWRRSREEVARFEEEGGRGDEEPEVRKSGEEVEAANRESRGGRDPPSGKPGS